MAITTKFTETFGVEHPIAQGGMQWVGTADLVAPVANAGALGFIAAGYLSADVFAERLRAAAELTSGPLGANLFVPHPSAATPESIDRYAAALSPDAHRYGAELGSPRFSDDDWTAKLEVLLDIRPALVSFTFGLPSAPLSCKASPAHMHSEKTATMGTASMTGSCSGTIAMATIPAPKPAMPCTKLATRKAIDTQQKSAVDR